LDFPGVPVANGGPSPAPGNGAAAQDFISL
jgi:hypothetical protein